MGIALTPKQRKMIIGKIRQIWLWSRERREIRDSATCRSCNRKDQKLFVDHIEPVFDPAKPDPFSTVLNKCVCEVCKWFRRLFVTVEGLQPLCKDCHGKKTKAENAQRRLTRVKKAA
jgi:5-methylcytosine-specific restriction endonuclease McrA